MKTAEQQFPVFQNTVLVNLYFDEATFHMLATFIYKIVGYGIQENRTTVYEYANKITKIKFDV